MSSDPIESIKSKLKNVYEELRNIADEVEQLHDDLCSNASLPSPSGSYGGWQYGLTQMQGVLTSAETEHANTNGAA